MHRALLATILLLGAAPLYANPVRCENGELVRTVEVVYADPGQPVPCEVIYDKTTEGSVETLWQARNEAGYCESNAQEFVTKLEGWGWKCAAVEKAAPAPITEPAEAPAAESPEPPAAEPEEPAEATAEAPAAP